MNHAATSWILSTGGDHSAGSHRLVHRVNGTAPPAIDTHFGTCWVRDRPVRHR